MSRTVFGGATFLAVGLAKAVSNLSHCKASASCFNG